MSASGPSTRASTGTRVASRPTSLVWVARAITVARTSASCSSSTPAQTGVRPGRGSAVPAGGGEDEVGLALDRRQRRQPGEHLGVVGDPERPLLEARRVAGGVGGEVAVLLDHVVVEQHGPILPRRQRSAPGRERSAGPMPALPIRMPENSSPRSRPRRSGLQLGQHRSSMPCARAAHEVADRGRTERDDRVVARGRAGARRTARSRRRRSGRRTASSPAGSPATPPRSRGPAARRRPTSTPRALPREPVAGAFRASTVQT